MQRIDAAMDWSLDSIILLHHWCGASHDTKLQTVDPAAGTRVCNPFMTVIHLIQWIPLSSHLHSKHNWYVRVPQKWSKVMLNSIL